MFPHTITIINIIDGVYYKTIVNDVFYISEKIVSQEGNGEKYSNTHRCIFSKKSLENYVKNKDRSNPSTFSLKINDIIIKGETSDVTSIKDIQNGNYDYFLIKTISNNDYGSNELQNIEVTD